jgi:uncharacterized protein (TIGR02300 family)
MSKPEFGHKLTCIVCAVRFYDLARIPAVCPKCGAEQPPLTARGPGASRIAKPHWSTRGGAFSAATADPAEPAQLETDSLDEADEADEADKGDEDGDETVLDDEDE